MHQNPSPTNYNIKHFFGFKINIIYKFITASQNNTNRSTFYLVFEFCEHDLAGLISNINLKFNLCEIKNIMQQMLNALHYIHGNKVSTYLNLSYNLKYNQSFED